MKEKERICAAFAEQQERAECRWEEWTRRKQKRANGKMLLHSEARMMSASHGRRKKENTAQQRIPNPERPVHQEQPQHRLTQNGGGSKRAQSPPPRPVPAMHATLKEGKTAMEAESLTRVSLDETFLMSARPDWLDHGTSQTVVIIRSRLFAQTLVVLAFRDGSERRHRTRPSSACVPRRPTREHPRQSIRADAAIGRPWRMHRPPDNPFHAFIRCSVRGHMTVIVDHETNDPIPRRPTKGKGNRGRRRAA